MARMTPSQRAEKQAQRKRDRLQNNRAVGGISLSARKKIGGGSVSLAEAIIISRLEKAGKLDSHTHNQIKDMALKMIGARGRSVGFIAAGWLQSIQTLAKKTGKPFRAGAGLKAFSRNAIGRMGYCIAASDMTFRPRALIENHANSNNDHKQALVRYGQPALQQAFDDETRSMKDYLASRMKKEAQAMGIKTG